MDDGGGCAREPLGGAASVVAGFVLGALTAGAVLLFAEATATADVIGTLVVWVILAPLTTVAVMSAAAVALWRLAWPVRRWWWTIALPPVLALVLAFGVFAGGPAGTMSERATGWAVVGVAVAVGVGVAAGRRAPAWIRVLAVAVAIGAAPAMVVHDRASQDRWRDAAHARDVAARAAAFAGVPEVLPVIAGYRPSATAGQGSTLQVDMTGPTTTLRIRIYRCTRCEARTGSDHRTFVVDGYALEASQFDGRAEMLTAMTDVEIRIRPAGRGELAALPAASFDDGD